MVAFSYHLVFYQGQKTREFDSNFEAQGFCGNIFIALVQVNYRDVMASLLIPYVFSLFHLISCSFCGKWKQEVWECCWWTRWLDTLFGHAVWTRRSLHSLCGKYTIINLEDAGDPTIVVLQSVLQLDRVSRNSKMLRSTYIIYYPRYSAVGSYFTRTLIKSVPPCTASFL
jgi:hypothetical protein